MSDLVRAATAADVNEVVRLRQAMFTAMAAAGAAARPEVASETSWHPAARRDISAGIDAGTLRACVIDDPDRGRTGCSPQLVACAGATLEQRLPGPSLTTGRSGSTSSVFVAPAHRSQAMIC